MSAAKTKVQNTVFIHYIHHIKSPPVTAQKFSKNMTGNLH